MNKKEFGYAYDDTKRMHWRKKQAVEEKYKAGELTWAEALSDSHARDREFINSLTTLIVNYLGVNYEKS